MNIPKIAIPFGFAAPSLSSAAGGFTVNQVVACEFEVKGFSVTINNVLWACTVAPAGHVGFGIYAVTTGSATRGARLADTGPIVPVVATITTPFITPVTLPCGIYCMAFTLDNASITVQQLNVAAFLPFNATPEIFYGTAANASAAGQLPATLGLITAAAGGRFPLVMLSN